MSLPRRLTLAEVVLMLTVAVFSVAACGGADGVTESTGGGGPVDAELAKLGPQSGLGDEYFPLAGNQGYDVQHYDITLDFDPAVGDLSGTTVVEVKALADLDEFDLDLRGLEVQGVQVDGVAADYQRIDQELIVDPPKTVSAGSTFSVAVTYSGTPQALTSADGYPEGWQHSGDTIFTLDEPEGAATWYPLNDHPSDKATYSFYLTVPEPYVAVANGSLLDTQELEGRRTYVWEMEQPMANYLASVVAGDLVLEQSTSPDGVQIRNYFARDVAEVARAAFASTGRAIDFFAGLFGPYPFEVYGVVVPDASTKGAAMENQTASLFGRDVVEERMLREYMREMYVSHELAHQWFGGSVTLAEWKDIWLNEGFATYASWLWLEKEYGSRAMQVCAQSAYEAVASNEVTLLGDPGVDELFGSVVYERGGLTLYALRDAVGDDLLFGILRDWASQHSYGSVTTEDFIALVKQKTVGLAGFDAEAFFDAWLYQKALPDKPAGVAAGLRQSAEAGSELCELRPISDHT
jgi:aminopeptidase N